MQEKEILLKAHYEVGKKLSALRAKLEVFENEYEAIGNRLAELERDKNLINRFRQYEDDREYKAMDTGKIPQLKSTNPAKKRKVEETVSAAEIQLDDVVQEEIIATAAADSGIVQTIQLEPDSDNMENIQLETELVTVIVDAPPPTTSATAFVPPAMASAPPTSTVTAFVPPAMASAPPASTVPAFVSRAMASAPAGCSATAVVSSTAPTAKVSKRVTTGRCSREATGPAPMEGRDLTRFYCLNCPKNFKNAKHLKEHVDYRCGQTVDPFVCGVCRKGFKTKEGIDDHMGAFHTQVKRHECHLCEQKFFYRKELRAHVEADHQ